MSKFNHQRYIPRVSNPGYVEEEKPMAEKSILISKVPIRESSKTTSTKREIRISDSRMKKSELEENLEKMNHSTLVSAYIQLMDKLRLMEKQSEVRESLLKFNQMKLEETGKENLELLEELRKLRSGSIEQEASERRIVEANGPIKCRFNVAGCRYQLQSMNYHEYYECEFRPIRCPSLTCSDTPFLIDLWRHIDECHDGNFKGKDKICRNSTSHLISSYVNIDEEPIFYKTTKMTWVANEMALDGKRFFLECMRAPPNWHIWVYIIGTPSEAVHFQATITLFKEDEVGEDSENGVPAQRSYTGPAISINQSKEEIAENGMGFMVHDKQIKPLCGSVSDKEEQLFGYEVAVYHK